MIEPGPSGQDMAVPAVAIVGPTASGKTELALALAEEFNGEIVNSDSMQLYRGLDIGTAKTRPSQWRGIPHHLLDIWDISTVASVAEYQRLARAAISEISVCGRLPIIVGGSGLYVRAVIDDLRFPGTDPQIRARWEQQLQRLGPAALHAELARRDESAARAILPNNGRRIVRALEVIELTGRFQAQLPAASEAPFLECLQIGLELDRATLDLRIRERVERMFQDGFVAEVQQLLDQGLADAPTASRALGYPQVTRLIRGEIDAETAREEITVATRRFARRQRSWFNRDERVEWLSAADPARLYETAATLVAAERL